MHSSLKFFNAIYISDKSLDNSNSISSHFFYIFNAILLSLKGQHTTEFMYKHLNIFSIFYYPFNWVGSFVIANIKVYGFLILTRLIIKTSIFESDWIKWAFLIINPFILYGFNTVNKSVNRI